MLDCLGFSLWQQRRHQPADPRRGPSDGGEFRKAAGIAADGERGIYASVRPFNHASTAFLARLIISCVRGRPVANAPQTPLSAVAASPRVTLRAVWLEKLCVALVAMVAALRSVSICTWVWGADGTSELRTAFASSAALRSSSMLVMSGPSQRAPVTPQYAYTAPEFAYHRAVRGEGQCMGSPDRPEVRRAIIALCHPRVASRRPGRSMRRTMPASSSATAPDGRAKNRLVAANSS